MAIPGVVAGPEMLPFEPAEDAMASLIPTLMRDWGGVLSSAGIVVIAVDVRVMGVRFWSE